MILIFLCAIARLALKSTHTQVKTFVIVASSKTGLDRLLRSVIHTSHLNFLKEIFLSIIKCANDNVQRLSENSTNENMERKNYMNSFSGWYHLLHRFGAEIYFFFFRWENKTKMIPYKYHINTLRPWGILYNPSCSHQKLWIFFWDCGHFIQWCWGLKSWSH